MKNLFIIVVIFTIKFVAAQEVKTLKEIVFSATKRENERKEISQTIDIISAKTLKFNSASNTGNVLQNTGMITVQQSQNGGGSPIMRGFEANRIGIVVDGVRMNNAIFRGGHLQNILRVDNGQLDRVEIFYGAGSTLYGSDALGGVFNIVTIKPELNTNGLHGSAFARYTNAIYEKTGGITLKYGTNKLASITSFTYSDFGNVMMGSQRDPQYGDWGKRLYYTERVNGVDVMTVNQNPNEQVNTGYKQYNVLQKFLWQPCDMTSHTFNFQYSNSSDINRYDRLTEKADNLTMQPNPMTNKFSSAEWYYGPEARLMAAYTFDHQLERKMADRLRLTTAYQNYKESRNTRNFNNLNIRSQRENVDIASVNLDLFKNTGAHQLTYGLDLNNNWVGSSVKRFNINTGAESYASTRYPDGGSRTGSYGAYVQDIIDLTRNLAYLNLGARYSYNTISSNVSDTNRKYGSFDISNHSYSINAGLSILPSQNNKITLNFSTGYRSPNLDDVTKVFDNTSFIQVNDPNLKPELAMNYEINSWNKFGKDLTFEFGGYYTAIQDYIINQSTTLNGNVSEIINGKTYAYQRLGNANSAYIYGAYSNMNWDLSKNFNFNCALNYTYGRVKSGSENTEKPLDHIPPMSARLAMKYMYGSFNSEVSMLMNSEKSAANYSTSGEDNIDKSADPINGYTPAFSVYNLRTSYDITPKYNLQAALENILDTHYRVFASGISSPGRSLRLTLRASF